MFDWIMFVIDIVGKMLFGLIIAGIFITGFYFGYNTVAYLLGLPYIDWTLASLGLLIPFLVVLFCGDK